MKATGIGGQRRGIKATEDRSPLQAQGDGGAIVITNSQAINVLDPLQAYRATVQISGTLFINNTAQNGGGISVTASGLIISNSLFNYNFATQAGAGRGGAIVGESGISKREVASVLRAFWWLFGGRGEVPSEHCALLPGNLRCHARPYKTTAAMSIDHCHCMLAMNVAPPE